MIHISTISSGKCVFQAVPAILFCGRRFEHAKDILYDFIEIRKYGLQKMSSGTNDSKDDFTVVKSMQRI